MRKYKKEKCLEPDCNFFGCLDGRHIGQKHKLTKEQYAKKHNTEKIKLCLQCKKEFYHQRQRVKCCCIRCASIYSRPKVTQTKRQKGGYFSTNGPKKAAKKSNETMRQKDGYYSTDGPKKRAEKAVITRQTRGTDKIIYEKARKTRLKKYGVYTFIFPNFSLESQELFMILEENLPKELICYYATKENEFFGTQLENGFKVSGEFQVWVKGNKYARFLDFYIPSINKCIEFDEKHHDKNKDNDLIRECDIKKIIPDIQILRVRKDEFLGNREVTIQRCLDFINIDHHDDHIAHPQQLLSVLNVDMF